MMTAPETGPRGPKNAIAGPLAEAGNSYPQQDSNLHVLADTWS